MLRTKCRFDFLFCTWFTWASNVSQHFICIHFISIAWTRKNIKMLNGPSWSICLDKSAWSELQFFVVVLYSQLSRNNVWVKLRTQRLILLSRIAYAKFSRHFYTFPNQLNRDHNCTDRWFWSVRSQPQRVCQTHNLQSNFSSALLHRYHVIQLNECRCAVCKMNMEYFLLLLLKTIGISICIGSSC